MSSTKKSITKPYVENYPPLHDWLRTIGAQCDWQLPLGPGPQAYVESYSVRGRPSFIVIVRANQLGWDIFTSLNDGRIDATLADAAKRIGLTGVS